MARQKDAKQSLKNYSILAFILGAVLMFGPGFLPPTDSVVSGDLFETLYKAGLGLIALGVLLMALSMMKKSPPAI